MLEAGFRGRVPFDNKHVELSIETGVPLEEIGDSHYR